jgi:hypothetical protein
MGVLGALGWLTAVVACSLLLDSASAAVTAKPATMATHQAFLNAGKVAGLEIWRIEVCSKQHSAYLLNNMCSIVKKIASIKCKFNCSDFGDSLDCHFIAMQIQWCATE